MRTLLDAGVGIEAGVWSVEDAERLAAMRTGRPGDEDPRRARRRLRRRGGGDRRRDPRRAGALGVIAPRLQHGDGEATWAAAARRGPARDGHPDRLRGHGRRARWLARGGQRGARARRARPGRGLLVVVGRAPARALALRQAPLGLDAPRLGRRPSAWSGGAGAAPRAHGSGARAGAPARARGCAPGCGRPAPRRARPGRSGP